MATIISTPLVILSILFILTCTSIPSFSCPSHQKQALLHFKSSLTTTINSSSYQLVQLNSWNSASNCCSWERVNCTRTKTVTELHLGGLVVPLPDINPPPVFSNILAPLFQIESLKLLDISNNSLQGEIPRDGFVNLTELVHLEMQDNRFNDSIPSQLFKLKSLRVLDLSDNTLEGGLSVEVGRLLNLETLFLGGNFLSGKIPQEIGNLTMLREFSLQNNHFLGGIPSSIVNLRNLETLDLSKNAFSMQIPTSIGTLSKIIAIDLSHNSFTGPIPSSMQNMSKLRLIRVDNNMLVGKIPTWLFNITTLKQLFIGGKGNGLLWNNEAKIVPNFCLRMLSMSSCNISGQIPEWISSQKHLILIDLSQNNLEGRFPDFLLDGKLEIIILSENKLSGLIPPLIIESENLLILELARNNFCGELPENIGNAKRISYLCQKIIFQGNFQCPSLGLTV